MSFHLQCGFRSGPFFATAAGLAETLGGVLLATGLLGPVGPALIVSVMTVAAITVHVKNGLFATSNGIEVPLLYATAAVAIAFMGAGRFSLDAVYGIGRLWTAGWIAVALALGLLGGIGNV